MEKSIATEPKSEYLSSLKKGSKKLVLEKTEETVPLEILELYETAEYYGVKTNNLQESGK